MTKVAVENVNHPGSSKPVDAVVYDAVRRAYLAILSSEPDGLTLAEISRRLGTHLSERTFSDGAGLGWWAKTVQLDLEAKGLVRRGKSRPLRLRKT
ncbi:hypothetical protein AB4144_05350 [Rhizobiaceae sp. 2RAB30]